VSATLISTIPPWARLVATTSSRLGWSCMAYAVAQQIEQNLLNLNLVDLDAQS
jgi:hypothetical protein